MKPLDSPKIFAINARYSSLPKLLITTLTLLKHEEIDDFWVVLFSASQFVLLVQWTARL